MQLSVIIPTRNRAGFLPDLLASLKRQCQAPFHWEILLIDNGSTDDTRAVACQAAQDFPVPLRYVSEPRPGLHQGRNRGAREAKGKMLAFLDDDMIVSPDWVLGGRLVADGGMDAVIGRVLPLWQGEIPAWSPFVYDGKCSGYWSLLDLGDAVTEIDVECAMGGNCFIRKDVVVALKGFHPDGMPRHLIQYRGDGENGFFRKFRQAGYRICYDPAPVAYHKITPAKLSFDYILEVAFRQGISSAFAEIRKNGGLPHESHLRMDNAYKKGMLFLREKILEDPALLKWILRRDFFEDDAPSPEQGGTGPGAATGEKEAN